MIRSIWVLFSPFVVLVACGSDQHPAQSPASSPPSPFVATAPVPAATTASLTTTGVYLDPTIASACGIPQPKMFFPFDSAEVKNSDSATVDKLSQCLMSGPLKGKSLEIIGRTDPRGGDDYNKQLGKTRADSVSEVLSSHGISQAMLRTRSTGEEKATGTDENGWAYDRRVDIRLAK